MANYGLIGKTLAHSFSKEFFRKKFEKENRSDTYKNLEFETVELLESFLIENKMNFKGFNVTHPYKQYIIQFLDRIDKEAEAIGAVNTVKISPTKKLIGYNTDHYGFALTLTEYLPLKERTALILGTGGAAKAIAYVLKTMGFSYKYVSRNGFGDVLRYQDVDERVMAKYFLIINCTPVGTFPRVEECPKLPYQCITEDHVLIDLIYNPGETEFLKRGFAQGAKISNGLKMLEYQAKKSWSIWQK